MTTYIKMGDDTVNQADVTKPDNRNFRDAWQLNGDVIEVNMTKARLLHQNKIRVARVAEFEKNDIALRDALLSGADTSTAVARRDALRNAPADAGIADAKNPDDLAKVWPAELSEVKI